ncbi:MAG: hypothetical protein J2P20_00115 [Pseudonocardia sp.]|nr:hypothetical protein [Pseudonocardia sp.]
MTKFLLIVIGAAFLWARSPHLLEVVLLVGLVVWMGVCARASRGGGAAMSVAVGRGGGGLSCHFCAFEGDSVREVADHEGGHVAVAEALGYKVEGAALLGRGAGVTWVGGKPTPWDAIRIAAAGTSAENLSRWIFKEPLNGSRSDGRSDAWRAHSLAPQLAKERGISARQVIEQAEAEATSILKSSSGAARMRSASRQLASKGRFGQVPR